MALAEAAPAVAVAPGHVPVGCGPVSPLVEVIMAVPEPNVADRAVNPAGTVHPCAAGTLSAQ
jgi:hypothetical protein